MLLLKYNEYYDLYDEEERTEFLFRIFKHVILGGDPEQVCSKIMCTMLILVPMFA